ncbi:hypothetical protein [Roseateles puraquae]|uniref:hypothetical protein n=1 Tax=Roseateles puraquae TaxID=431059 RepID=UPI0031D636D3
MKRVGEWLYPDLPRPLTQFLVAAIWMGAVANWLLWKQRLVLPEVGGDRLGMDLGDLGAPRFGTMRPWRPT